MVTQSIPHVSVVIPVYNAASFVEEAVKSALQQPETAEVILVEDGSPDNSLAVCTQLCLLDTKIKLYTHPQNENRGAAASRNLGIEKSTFEKIAFLDADDYFLPGYLATANYRLDSSPDADGVYNAVGVHFESEQAKQIWQALGREHLTTISVFADPEELFQILLSDKYGHLHLNGLVIKRQACIEIGSFDIELDFHQDTAFFIKLAAQCRLISGETTKPVAIRRVHDHNRITADYQHPEKYRMIYTMWNSLFQWSRKTQTPIKQAMLLAKLLAIMQGGRNLPFKAPRYVRAIWGRGLILVFALKHPYIFSKKAYCSIYFKSLFTRRKLWVYKSYRRDLDASYGC